MDYRYMATMAAMVECEAKIMGPLLESHAKIMGPLLESHAKIMGPLLESHAKIMGPLLESQAQSMGPLLECQAQSMGPLLECQAQSMGPLLDQAVKAAEDSTRLRFSMLERSIPDRARQIPTSTGQNRDQQTIMALKSKVANLNRENEILIEENALLDEPPRLKCDDDDWV